MKKVFLLQHSYERDESGVEETKLIGVYSTRERAEQAIVRLSNVEGFRDYPDCFCVDGYEIDKDHWVDGFVTIAPQ